MNFRKHATKAPEVNITPLVDVVFILLIFFAVTTTFVYFGGIRVDLPKAATATDVDKAVVRVMVSKENVIYIDGTAVEANDLAGAFRQAKSDKPEASLVIEADKDAMHGVVITVIDEGKQAGFERFAIATEDLK
jgi:biopolymer transport protein ExbD